MLVIDPFECERATKSGYYDETVVLDGDLAPGLGRLMVRQAKLRIKEERLLSAGQRFQEEDVLLWRFGPKEFLQNWRGGAEGMDLQEMETVYQARHGGASRDLLLKTRTPQEVMLRGFWASINSMRTYHKPGRIAQLANTLHPDVAAYAGIVRTHFEEFMLAGRFPAPPKIATRKTRQSS